MIFYTQRDYLVGIQSPARTREPLTSHWTVLQPRICLPIGKSVARLGCQIVQCGISVRTCALGLFTNQITSLYIKEIRYNVSSLKRTHFHEDSMNTSLKRIHPTKKIHLVFYPSSATLIPAEKEEMERKKKKKKNPTQQQIRDIKV